MHKARNRTRVDAYTIRTEKSICRTVISTASLGASGHLECRCSHFGARAGSSCHLEHSAATRHARVAISSAAVIAVLMELDF